MLKAGCWTTDRLALYLDHRLDAAERERAEEHLSDCESCRHRLVALYTSRGDAGESAPDRAPAALKEAARAMVRRPEPARSGRWLTAVAAVVIAALGLAIFLLPTPTEEPVDDVLRLDAPGLAAPRALAPSDGAAVPAAAIDFRSTAVPEARRYTLTLLDALGDVVHRESAAEPRWVVDASPSGLDLRPGATYYWYVGVDLADGTSAESEIVRFTLQSPP